MGLTGSGDDVGATRLATGAARFILATFLVLSGCGSSSQGGGAPQGSGGNGVGAAGGQGGNRGTSATAGTNSATGGAAGAAGIAGVAGTTGTGAAAGAVGGPPSCAGLQGTECQGGDCCDSPLVPGGNVFKDGTAWTVPSFRLDRYEVTVARFRNFVNAAPAWQAAGNPVQGAGAHPSVPGSGWRTDWMLGAWLANGLVPTWYGYPTSWGSTPDSVLLDGVAVYVVPGSDLLAVNWVPFNIAFAFCIWDGGRLPAQVEWMLAAHGGAAQTTYPWGNSPTSREMFAVLPPVTVTTTYVDSTWKYHAIPVGSVPASAGLYGQEDLAAGLYEYLRDTVPSAAAMMGGMIELGDDNQPFTGLSRMIAGGSWEQPLGVLDGSSSLGVGDGDVGFRCARDP